MTFWEILRKKPFYIGFFFNKILNVKLFIFALGFTILLEGLLPFFFPNAYKRFLKEVSETDPEILRLFGFLAIIAGLVILYLTKGSL